MKKLWQEFLMILVALAFFAGQAWASDNESQQPGIYTVQKGDNLYRISRAFGCDLKKVAAENGIKDAKMVIFPGQRIRLSCVSSAVTADEKTGFVDDLESWNLGISKMKDFRESLAPKKEKGTEIRKNTPVPTAFFSTSAQKKPMAKKVVRVSKKEQKKKNGLPIYDESNMGRAPYKADPNGSLTKAVKMLGIDDNATFVMSRKIEDTTIENGTEIKMVFLGDRVKDFIWKSLHQKSLKKSH